MAPRLSTILLAAFAGASGVVSQDQKPVVVTGIWPGGFNATDTVMASATVIDANAKETLMSLSCADPSAEGCSDLVGLVYKTSPGGMRVEFATTMSEANTTRISGTPTTNFVVMTTLHITVDCPTPAPSADLTCKNIVSGNVAVSDKAVASTIKESFSTTITETYTGTTNVAAFTITAGDFPTATGTGNSPAAPTTTSQSTGAAAPMITQNAMLAGAMAVLGGALLI